MDIVWRFFQDGEQKWKWVKMNSGDCMLAESQHVFPDYEACLADAKLNGYAFLPAQVGTRRVARNFYYS